MNGFDNNVVLREYIQKVLKEEKFTLGDNTFMLSDKEVSQVEKFLITPRPKGLGKKVYDSAEAWSDFVLNLGPRVGKKLNQIIQSAVPEVFQETIREILIKQDPEALKSVLFRATPQGTVEIPEPLQELAEFRTGTASGTQVGRGELVIPFMFRDASVDPGSNALYDVWIGGGGYHVKEASPTGGIKFGSAVDKSFTAIPLYKKLAQIESPSVLSGLGISVFQKRLPLWAKKMKMSPNALYSKINGQTVKAALGGAAGVIWKLKNKPTLVFSSPKELWFQATTQNRIILSTVKKLP